MQGEAAQSTPKSKRCVTSTPPDGIRRRVRLNIAAQLQATTAIAKYRAKRVRFCSHRHYEDFLEIPVPFERALEGVPLHVVEGDDPDVSLCAVSTHGGLSLLHH